MRIFNRLLNKDKGVVLLKNKDFSASSESGGAIRETGQIPPQNTPLKAQFGRTMVEMLAVLGVLGIIAGGGTYGFAYAIDVFKSWSTQTQIANFSKGIEDLYGWRSDYNDVSMTGNGGICNNARDILQQACEGDVFKSNWGGSLYAQPAAGGQGYKIILTDVPVRACKMLADMHWERVRLLDTSCNANRQTLTFVSYMQSECNPECSGNQTCKGGVCVCANGGIGESCDIVDPCETMNCEGVCRTGECLNGRCETVANGTSCEGGRCFDGECVVCISHDDCPECQACVGNVCRNRADGEVCSEGVCQNGVCGSADLCADVVCEECNTCNSDTGACEAVADGTACGTNGVCTSGVCDLCANVTCEEMCAACNPSTGACEAAPDGTVCSGGVCTSGVCACNGNSCGAQEFCADANSSCTSRTPNQCTSLNGYFARKTITVNGNTETWYVSNYVSWWDAESACTAAGLTMATVNDLIDNWNGTAGTKTRTERAQRLYDAIGSYYVWTSDDYSSCSAFRVNLSSGFVGGTSRESRYNYLALCRADLCTNVTCGECNICNPVTGACEAAPDGTACSGGVCTSGVCDLCANVTCGECNTCNPSTGACKAVADGTACGTNGVCTSGVCDLCANVTCGEVCAACNPVTGTCEAAPNGTACGENRTCSDGVCVDSCSTNDDCGINGFCKDRNSSCTSRTPNQCRSLNGYFARKTITVNGKTETWYVSNGRIVSWWDAEAACTAAGLTMATVNELVSNWSSPYPGIFTRTERAQRLSDAIGSEYVWTSDDYSSCYAILVDLSNGEVRRNTRNTNYARLALCH